LPTVSNKRLRILLVSVLDRADHPRIAAKEAKTLSSAYDCTICAAGLSNDIKKIDGIDYLLLPPVSVRSFRRILRVFELIRIIRQQKPDVLHLHSIELLLPVGLFCSRPSMLVFYDRHEDYSRNIRYGNHIHPWFRKPLSWLVNLHERAMAKKLHGIIYAESSFQGRLPVPEAKTVVVRNTYQGNRQPDAKPISSSQNDIPILLYSGTIAEEWGALRCIEFWKFWCLKSKAILQFVGPCFSPRLKEEIWRKVRNSPFPEAFEWPGNGDRVSYQQIEQAISECSFGLALYQVTLARADRVPARFYEYMAWQKPLVFSNHPPWDAMNTRIGFGISMPDQEPLSEEVERVREAFLQGFPTCFQNPLPAKNWHWSTDGQALMRFYEQQITLQRR